MPWRSGVVGIAGERLRELKRRHWQRLHGRHSLHDAGKHEQRRGAGARSRRERDELKRPVSRALQLARDWHLQRPALWLGGRISGGYSFRGVFNVGTGNAGLLDSPWEFFIAGPSTIYVADDDATAPATGGLQKWLFSSGSRSKAWTATASGATGMRGLTGVVTGNAVQLYGITAVSTGTGANALVALSDTLDGTSAPSFSTLATAPLNCVFRGVAPAPVPEGRDGVSRGDAECGMHRLKTCATRACCGTGYQPVLRDAEVAQVFNLCLIRRRLQTCVPSAAGTRAALPTAPGSPAAGSVASFLRGSSGMPLGRRGPACSARAA